MRKEKKRKEKEGKRRTERQSRRKITWPMWSQFELLSLHRLIPLCPSPRRLTGGRVVTGTAKRGNNEEEGRHLDQVEQRERERGRPQTTAAHN